MTTTTGDPLVFLGAPFSADPRVAILNSRSLQPPREFPQGFDTGFPEFGRDDHIAVAETEVAFSASDRALVATCFGSATMVSGFPSGERLFHLDMSSLDPGVSTSMTVSSMAFVPSSSPWDELPRLVASTRRFGFVRNCSDGKTTNLEGLSVSTMVCKCFPALSISDVFFGGYTLAVPFGELFRYDLVRCEKACEFRIDPDAESGSGNSEFTTGIACDPTRDCLLSCGPNDLIRIFSLRTCQVERRFPFLKEKKPSKESAYCLYYAQDLNLIFAGGSEGISVFDIRKTDARLRRYEGFSSVWSLDRIDEDCFVAVAMKDESSTFTFHRSGSILNTATMDGRVSACCVYPSFASSRLHAFSDWEEERFGFLFQIVQESSGGFFVVLLPNIELRSVPWALLLSA